MRIALNGELAPNDSALSDGDEVVLLPPVAGGSGVSLVEVREGALSVDECARAVSHAGAGAVCVFTGVVRDHADGRAVARLDYEAYVELAVKEMRRILDAIVEARPGVRLAATHRVGRLAIGDVAVVVAASAPHREDAFLACREAIDRIKETVPIWKKEWGKDGEGRWVNLDP
jgi:molybdopterin synthase catalytic subunit